MVKGAANGSYGFADQHLLTSVALVCRSNTRVDALPHVASSVNAYLDSTSLWSISSACKKQVPGLLRLLKRIDARENHRINPFVKQKVFSDALEAAIENGNLDVARWLVEEYNSAGVIRRAISTAVSSGRVDFLRWLRGSHDARVIWSQTSLAQARSVEVAKWFHENISRATTQDKEYLLMTAMMIGALALLEWLFCLDPPPSNMDVALRCGARWGQRAALMWTISRRHANLDQGHMDEAISFGKTELAQWLYKRGVTRFTSVEVLLMAAKLKRFDTVKWALETLTVLNADRLGCVVDAAAEHGRLDVIQLLHMLTPSKWTTRAMDIAARSGHLNVVVWLHENRSEGCTPSAMDGAACNKHLETFEWLNTHRTEGCSTAAMDGAAEHNHLDMVKWLHRHRTEGCTTRAMDQAAANGHLEMVKWLHQYRTEGCTAAAMDGAAQFGHLSILKFLHEHRGEGFTNAAFENAARNGHLDVIEWLHCTCKQPIMESVIVAGSSRGRVKAVQWLLARFPGGSIGENAMEAAVAANDFNVVMALDDDRRCEWGDWSVRKALQMRRVEILAWMLDKLTLRVEDAMDRVHYRWREDCDEHEELTKIMNAVGSSALPSAEHSRIKSR